ncbi:MAG: hypothetical protein WAW92_03855 [Minisyncoccia bacterium]
MQPLNTFPDLLDFGRISPFIIRVIVGLFIIYLGKQGINKKFNALSFVYYLCGFFLVLGYYTQISSIVGALLLKLDFYMNYWKNRKSVPIPKYFYFLYTIASLVLISLLFSGSGAFALDMPF